MAGSVIGALRVNLGLDSAQFVRGAKQAESTTKRIGRSMQKIGAAVSVASAGIALAVRGQLNLADEAGKAAQTLGLPVEQLTRYRHAAALSNVSTSTLEGAFQRLSRNMVDNADDFEALGISVRDANGDMRSADHVMADLADVMAAMPDGAEKTALAMELMGRAGADLIPMLNGGRDALQDMLDEADKLGLTISAETAEAAAQFNDNLTRLTGTMRGWVTIITAELAPVLARISDAVVAASEQFQGMSPVMRQVAAAVAGIIVVAGPLILGLGTLLVMGKAVIAPFAGLAGLLGGAFKVAVAGAAAVVATLGWPLTLAALAVAGITAAVIKFWPEIKAATAALVEWVRDGLQAAQEWLGKAGEAVARFTDDMLDLGNRGVEFVKQKFQELMSFLSNLGSQMASVGRDMLDGLVQGLEDRFPRASAAMRRLGGLLQRETRDAVESNSPSRAFARIGHDIVEGLVVGIEERDHVAPAAMARVTDQLQDQVGGAASSMSGMFENAFTGIVTGSQTAREAIGRLLQDLARMMAQRAFQALFGGMIGGGGGGFLGSLFGGFRADGGPVSAGRSYMVGERGPELFTPGASGQITSNEALRGAGEPVQVVVRVMPSGEFDARVENTARAVVRVETPGMIGGAFRRAREQRGFE